MRRRHPEWTLLVALCAIALPAASQSPIPASGRVLAASCSGCHGPGGHSPGAIPSIAGQSESQLTKSLLDFKNDRREATVMNRHAKGFTDDELQAIAREISSQWR